MIQSQGDKLEFIVISSIYKDKVRKIKTPAGEMLEAEQKFVKHVRVKHLFDKYDCFALEYITRDNKVAKKRSTIYNRATSSYYVVAHSYQEVKNALTDKAKQSIGFKK